MDNLIQEIRSGNKEAIKSVYQAYAKDVYNFSKSITGDHDSALAATKKTFLVLFKNIQNGDEPQNIRTAALKIAYDEAYKLSSPEKEAAPAEEAASAEEAQPQAEEPVYAEPIFKPRTNRATSSIPVIDGYDHEYETEEPADPYDEEEDDFIAPIRPKKQEEPEGVYIPKGGYDTLKIEPMDVEEEQTEMRSRRRRPEEGYDDFDEPVSQPRRRRKNVEQVYDDDRDYDDRDRVDDYYDDDDYDDDYEEKKPRNKGLFIFCIILNIVLILILLWFLVGLLVNLGVLPDIDLGYSWFNGHIYPLF